MNKHQKSICKMTKKYICSEIRFYINKMKEKGCFARQCGKTDMQLQLILKLDKLTSKAHYRNIRKWIRELNNKRSFNPEYKCQWIIEE